jgi:hypothetical protein
VNAEHNAKSASTPRTGVFATLANLLHGRGSSAPATSPAKGTSAPSSLLSTTPAESPTARIAARLRTPRWAAVCVGLSLLFVCLSAPSAEASFGINNFDVTYTNQDGSAAPAGAHPFAMTTSFGTNYDGSLIPEGWIRDILFGQVPGFVADTTAYPGCTTADFLALNNNGEPSCPLSSQVGIIAVSATEAGSWETYPLFNVTPPPGTLLRLGFHVVTQNIFVDGGLNTAPPYNAFAASRNTGQLLNVFGVKAQLWGNPSDPAHNELRGPCGHQSTGLEPGDIKGFEFKETGESCPVAANPKPFLTTPTTCAEPLASSYEAISWNDRNEDGKPDEDSSSRLTHDQEGNPTPFGGCGALPAFHPSISAKPTTEAATSPTGLDFSLDVADEGLTSVTGRSQSDIEKAVVTLPAGMSVNPSQAEGLEVCSEEDLEAETLGAAPGVGCPQASKIGSLEVETPLVQEAIKGALYVAKPYENLADNSLIAVYAVFKNPKLGIIVKQALKVESNPITGQLTTVADEIPQLPFSHFRLHFREGTRSPLVSPPSCGAHQVKAMLYPWSGAAPVESTSTFSIISGPDNAPCPSGGLPPFHPGLIAGTLNNAAGHFSPFNVRLSRNDSEQEITHFSIKLPPGVVGKLAGIPFCSDAAIAAAKARTGPTGGAEELASPSCPAASEVGHTLVGAGVGPSLTYVPGKLYLAGPYHGSALSIVSITSGVAGPFDLGTVVVREALKINPETAEVFIDATGSDPIPHIIKGIPVHLRDIRIYTDRPEFVLNPTSCARTSTASTLLGSGLNFASEADDQPVTVSTPFQAADCASLGFKPKLSLSLKGATKRGSNPALRAVLAPRPGDANSARVSVQLPHSEFLDQSHIRTVCTRVQFNAGAGNGAGCPAGAIYGHARAFTPILSDPLEGPIFLRSSEHPLPDLVLALHGLIDVDAVGRIDSVNGGIRNTFDFVPDAPVSKVVVSFEGGNKGLLVNSTDLCKGKHRAIVDFTGHNGKVHNFKPVLGAKCGGKHKKGKRHHRAAG